MIVREQCNGIKITYVVREVLSNARILRLLSVEQITSDSDAGNTRSITALGMT